jgi:site-specific DNA-methyltransferase (adenine-specific)
MTTLIQGDCLEVLKSVPDGSVDMILADLPYGTTACKWDTVIPFEPMWEQFKRVTRKNAAIVLTASQPFTSALVMSNVKMFRYEWIWRKSKATGFALCKKRPMKKHENICVFSKKIPIYNPQGLIKKENPTINKGSRGKKGNVGGDVYGGLNKDAIQTHTNYPLSVIDFQVEHRPIHPTQKPVALMEYLIRTYTNEGDTVLDPTMGSGTTGVACKNLNRRFVGMEKDETYFAIAKARIEATPSPLIP